jgi:hypothetical protein
MPGTIVKVFIGVTNGLIIVGALVGGVVLYRQSGDLSYKDFEEATFAAKFLLGVAIVAVFAALFGLLAVCVQKKLVRGIYFAFVFVVLVLEAVGIAIAYLYPAKIEGVIQQGWNNTRYADVVKKLEVEFHCCGWDSNTYSYVTSCTEMDATCRDKINEKIQEYQTKIAIALIILVVFQVLVVACAIYLLCEKPEVSGDITRF